MNCGFTCRWSILSRVLEPPPLFLSVPSPMSGDNLLEAQELFLVSLGIDCSQYHAL